MWPTDSALNKPARQQNDLCIAVIPFSKAFRLKIYKRFLYFLCVLQFHPSNPPSFNRASIRPYLVILPIIQLSPPYAVEKASLKESTDRQVFLANITNGKNRSINYAFLYFITMNFIHTYFSFKVLTGSEKCVCF